MINADEEWSHALCGTSREMMAVTPLDSAGLQYSNKDPKILVGKLNKITIGVGLWAVLTILKWRDSTREIQR